MFVWSFLWNVKSENVKSNHYKSITFVHVFPCSKLSIPLFHLSIISVWTSNSTINWTELPLPFSVFCVPSPYRLGQNKYNTTAHLVQNYQFPLHLPAQDGPTTSLCFFVKPKQKHCGGGFPKTKITGRDKEYERMIESWHFGGLLTNDRKIG